MTTKEDSTHGKVLKETIYVPNTMEPAFGPALDLLDKLLLANVFDAVKAAMDDMSPLVYAPEDTFAITLVGPEFEYEDGYGGCISRSISLIDILVEWATDEHIEAEVRDRLSRWRGLVSRVDASFEEAIKKSEEMTIESTKRREDYERRKCPKFYISRTVQNDHIESQKEFESIDWVYVGASIIYPQRDHFDPTFAFSSSEPEGMGLMVNAAGEGCVDGFAYRLEHPDGSIEYLRGLLTVDDLNDPMCFAFGPNQAPVAVEKPK